MGTKTLNISDEERELLTEEELAGLEEGEDWDEGQPESQADDDDGDDQPEGNDDEAADDESADDDQGADEGNDDADQDEDGDDDGKQDDDDGADAGQDDAQGDDGNDEVDDTADQQPARVSFDVKLPDDYDDQVKAVTDAKKELTKQFGEGDLSVEEFQEKLDEQNRKERELERLKDRVEDSELRRKDVWVNVTVAGFMAEHAEYKANHRLFSMLDEEVRRLQASGKYASDTDPSILADAHKVIAEDFPEKFAKPAKDKQDDGKPAGKKIVPKASAPNLARTPAANVDQPGEGKFDWLDRLADKNPLKFEAELAKLSPADQDEYLAS